MSKWIFGTIFLLGLGGLYLIESKPKIICRIPCTHCLQGYVEHDLTKEAIALKGRSAFIKTKEGKTLRFDDCYGLKKAFWARKYTRHGDLIWAPIFTDLDTIK